MKIFKRDHFYNINKIKLSKFINIHHDSIILSSIVKDFNIKNISSHKIYNDNSIFFLKKNMLGNLSQIKFQNLVIITDFKEYFEQIKKKKFSNFSFIN